MKRGNPKLTPEPAEADLSEYALKGAVSIKRMITRLIKGGDPLLIFSESGRATITQASIDQYDEQTMTLEALDDAQTLARMKAGPVYMAVGMQDGLKIQIPLRVRSVGGSPRASIVCEPPAVLYRIQRRRAFRVKPPMGYTAAVLVRDGHQGEVTYPIVDLSVLGVAFFELANEPWPVGSAIEHARLHLGDDIELPITLKIVSSEEITHRGENTPVQRIGCELVGLPVEVSRRLQQTVHDMERTLRQQILA